ncbi:hypothetical protein BJF81_14685 [Ornithinimicrobium sp. CNJ-824]|nr:hypothetical protein BJF81_14685 [Ornithinimicrobium sp. CNJ-824]
MVKMNDRGSWEVLDDTGKRLFSGDKLRAQGFARRRCAVEGGSVAVVSRTGEQLAEFAVSPYGGQTPRALQRRSLFRRAGDRSR